MLDADVKPALVPEFACKDILQSKEFYTNILGFTILYERAEQGFYYLKRHSVELMIEQLSDSSWRTGELEQPFGRGMHFQIMVDDLAAIYERCIDNEILIFQELEEAWYRANDQYFGQQQFIICDPDGYMLRFAQDLGSQKVLPISGRVVS